MADSSSGIGHSTRSCFSSQPTIACSSGGSALTETTFLFPTFSQSAMGSSNAVLFSTGSPLMGTSLVASSPSSTSGFGSSINTSTSPTSSGAPSPTGNIFASSTQFALGVSSSTQTCSNAINTPFVGSSAPFGVAPISRHSITMGAPGSVTNSSLAQGIHSFGDTPLNGPSAFGSSAFFSSSISSTSNPIFGSCNSIVGLTGVSSTSQPFGWNTNSTMSPKFGFGFKFNSSSTQPTSFSNSPLSQTSQPFQFDISNLASQQNTTPPLSSPLTSSLGWQASTPTLHICPSCGYRSLWGQHWGSQVAAFSPTPEPGPESDIKSNPFNAAAAANKPIIMSISAMPIYKDKSQEELRWEDYKIQGKDRQTQTVNSSSEPFILGQPMWPVLVLFPVMPTSSISAFGGILCNPTSGPSVGLNPSGTTFAGPQTLFGAPSINSTVLGQNSSSSSATFMPAVGPLCEMFRRL